MPERWRLIPDLVADGATQMAIDAWLLDQLIGAQSPPTLRFYRWQPTAISLGYHQKQWPNRWRSLTWQNQSIDVVRRPSGGRAVLHQGDLTYAITMPLRGDRKTAYRYICNALIAAWQELGVTLTYGTAGSNYRHQANCFDLATAADLVTPEGYKLIGSAQLRRDRGLLQHGSMRLSPNLDIHTYVFGSALEVPEQPDTISQLLNTAGVSQLTTLITATLERSLGLSLIIQPLTDAEWNAIRERRADFLVL